MDEEGWLSRQPASRKKSLGGRAKAADSFDESSPRKLIKLAPTEEDEKRKKLSEMEAQVQQLEEVIERMKKNKEELLYKLKEMEKREDEMADAENQQLVTKKRLGELRSLCKSLELERDKYLTKIKERKRRREKLIEKKRELEEELSIQLMLDKNIQSGWGLSVPWAMLCLFLCALLLVGLLSWVEWDDGKYYIQRFRGLM